MTHFGSRLLLLMLSVNFLGLGSVDSVVHAQVEYELLRVLDVAGRQGVATDGHRYYVSSSTALYVYSKEGELIDSNEEPFAALGKKANHIGDISVYNGEIYAGIEWFEDGRGHDIQIAIYDAKSLQYRRSIPWEPDSGQVEVSALTVDEPNGLVWMTDWVNGTYVYRYDLAGGNYAGKQHLRPVPQGQQGIATHNGILFITADDGDAEHGEVLVLANRGKRIVLGMPKGLYPGYDREIHEIYVYRIK